jgi:hypothetical protein
MEIAFAPVQDPDALGRQWRVLEDESDASFFQSWTWTGTLFPARFPAPYVLSARQGNRTVALSLFNKAGDALHLGESGDRARDAIYIEHNGFLIARDQPPDLRDRLIHHLRRDADAIKAQTGTTRMRLSGIDAPTLFALTRAGVIRGAPRVDPAWFADLSPGFMRRRSANTRQMIRQSLRYYDAFGPLTLTRAETTAEAISLLSELIPLHQAHWTARGKPGAFADPFMERFHRALIQTGMPRHEIDLIRVSTPGKPIGVLYNFRHKGRVLSYQSGFHHDDTDRRQRPGIVSHVAAIEAGAAAGDHIYDFLAGDADYKRSLSDSYRIMAWCQADLAR